MVFISCFVKRFEAVNSVILIWPGTSFEQDTYDGSVAGSSSPPTREYVSLQIEKDDRDQ
jgi:hypothetical protein